MSDVTEKKMPEIDIASIGGNCPVQAEGTINGFGFYFRARGSHWSINVYDGSEEGWYHSVEYAGGEKYAAGWITEKEARGFIAESAELFASQRQSLESERDALKADLNALTDALCWNRGAMQTEARDLILKDAACLRPAMVEARRARDDAEGDAMLLHAFMSEESGLLKRIWDAKVKAESDLAREKERSAKLEAALRKQLRRTVVPSCLFEPDFDEKEYESCIDNAVKAALEAR